MTRPKDEVSDLSSVLLSEAQAVQDLERQKRGVPISTPEFHRLAEAIERRARRVFEIAATEERAGDGLTRDGDTIDDVASRED